ncbi:MAG: 23S rRNA (guanosine(2251)-2'-O)-methyltransferase RlmB [Spirochaetales bacterium]|nr:23S rRNA (guanosine(2251)-2'-O)-methyltransferase RlmB [Spirochaetales bacterium]
MKRYIVGFHAIEEALKRNKLKGSLYLSDTNGKKENLRILAQKANIKVNIKSQKEIADISQIKDNRGAVLEVFSENNKGYIDLKTFLANVEGENSLVVILDGITDPHNYGAIIRSADQFQADLIIVPEKRSAPESNIVDKTSAGAVNWVNISRVPNLVASIEQLKKAGYWVYGADMDGEDVSKADITGKTAIVLGREGEGLHKLTADTCDSLIKIPTSGKIDSLNVSVSAGILLYEYNRQINK